MKTGARAGEIAGARVQVGSQLCWGGGGLELQPGGTAYWVVQAGATQGWLGMQTLLGPLEQQEVNVAKAGLVASLPARTSLLAAANPAGGQYNRAKTLMQNLKMSAAMLSRFDIIFVLLDQPDQRRDERLSEHVMAMHSGACSTVHVSTCLDPVLE